MVHHSVLVYYDLTVVIYHLLGLGPKSRFALGGVVGGVEFNLGGVGVLSRLWVVLVHFGRCYCEMRECYMTFGGR